MKRGVLALACALLFARRAAGAQSAPAAPAQRPNIVVVVVDDAGFSDFGAYGGEAHTPNIDALARARRAVLALLHLAALRAVAGDAADGRRQSPHRRRDHSGSAAAGAARASRLHDAFGARRADDRRNGCALSAIAPTSPANGTWATAQGDLPNDHGFDRSFVLDASGADNWQEAPYMPYNNYAPWFENGQPAHLPSDFYSSRFIVDRMIQYLNDDQRANAPFFAYVAFQAVHIPVQAPREYTAHYLNTYDAGWDAVREARWRRVQALGLIPPGRAACADACAASALERANAG